MNKVFSFLLEGENIDGDFLTSYIEFENYEDSNDALKAAIKEAEDILKNVNGGHIDIFDGNAIFITDVEI